MPIADLLDEFYRAHPEHIAGIVTHAVEADTGVPRTGHHLDSESLRAFFVWLVQTNRRPVEVVERAYMAYHRAAPQDFPLPFPWDATNPEDK